MAQRQPRLRARRSATAGAAASAAELSIPVPEPPSAAVVAADAGSTVDTAIVVSARSKGKQRRVATPSPPKLLLGNMKDPKLYRKMRQDAEKARRSHKWFTTHSSEDWDEPAAERTRGKQRARRLVGDDAAEAASADPIDHEAAWQAHLAKLRDRAEVNRLALLSMWTALRNQDATAAVYDEGAATQPDDGAAGHDDEPVLAANPTPSAAVQVSDAEATPSDDDGAQSGRLEAADVVAAAPADASAEAAESLGDAHHLPAPNLPQQLPAPPGDGRIYRCDQCNVWFRTTGSLNRHRKTAHSAAAPPKWSCPHCIKEFSTKSNMQQHVARKHFGAVSMPRLGSLPTPAQPQ